MARATQRVIIVPLQAFVGNFDYELPAMDVSDFSEAKIGVWRGPSNASFEFALEGSVDGVTWVEYSAQDPGLDTEVTMVFEILYPLLRGVVKVGSSADLSGVMMWAKGVLIRRRS